MIDNRYGRGIDYAYGGTPDDPVFWITADCPLHGSNSTTTGGGFTPDGSRQAGVDQPSEDAA